MNPFSTSLLSLGIENKILISYSYATQRYKENINFRSTGLTHINTYTSNAHTYEHTYTHILITHTHECTHKSHTSKTHTHTNTQFSVSIIQNLHPQI